MKMKKIKLKVKLGIDIAMILIFLVNIFTGFAIFFGLVQGGGHQYRGYAKISNLNFTNLTNDFSSKTLFRLYHDWSGILFVILILVHLILNWNTLWCYFRNILKKPEKPECQLANNS